MLKKEIRVLGLSASREKKGRTIVVGVVFRGQSWLDGVLTCSLEAGRHDNVSILSREIVRCRQYSQLHAIIVSGGRMPISDLDVAQLEHRVKLPVISIVGSNRRVRVGNKGQRMQHHRLLVNGKRLVVSAKGVHVEKVQEILTTVSAPGSGIPEAVRVANLIADRVNP